MTQFLLFVYKLSWKIIQEWIRQLVVWVDVTDDESISFYTVVTLSLLVLSIMIDQSKPFNWYFFISYFAKKETQVSAFL